MFLSSCSISMFWIGIAAAVEMQKTARVLMMYFATILDIAGDMI